MYQHILAAIDGSETSARAFEATPERKKPRRDSMAFR
jgi:hypothetical protein